MLYLASKSPRRRELISRITPDFKVLDVDVEEVPGSDETPEDYVLRVAHDKAVTAKKLVDDKDIVIAADTEVVLDDSIIGKPLDEEDAVSILGRLSGRTHKVITVVIAHGINELSIVTTNLVRFREITEEERRRYCETCVPLDKAGAYGVQDAGAGFIERLEGSYSSVMGLPIKETRQLLQQSGLKLK
jgi:septum formation protein